MFALLLSVLATSQAGGLAEIPGLDDPILYPPEILPDEEVVGGELRVEGGGALVLEYTEVVAEVHAGLARVTMTQFFANPYDEPIEAKYLLPLPSSSAVYRMDLTVGDRVIEGVVMEREAARQTYEDAKEDGRKAALLEQQRDNLFTQYVAGICPGERVVVTLEYIEQLEYEDGLYTFALPTTVGPRFSPPWVEDRAELVSPYSRTGREVDITVHIEEGMPIEAMFSDTHAFDVIDEGSWGASVTLAEDDRVPNKDFSLTWALAGEQPRGAVLVHDPETEDGYIAVTLEPQVLGDSFEARPRELFFVIDSSCSMRGEPYETARATVLLALEEMSGADTFNLVRFANASTALFEAPQPATAANKARARSWLANFEGGGTNMDAGIIQALTAPGRREAMRLVLMLTDGYVGGEEQMFKVVRKHLGGARLFSMGVGSSVNRYLLEGLAEMGRGDVTYKLPGTPMAAAVRSFYDRIAHPAMSHIRLDWGGAEVYEQYPKRIPDLWAGQPIRVVARFKGKAPDEVRVSGIVGTSDYEMALPLEAPAVEPAHGAVATLWARRKIRDIEWYPEGMSAAEQREEILDVAISHHLVSKYTSLVAVDDEECPCGKVTRFELVPQEAVAGMHASQLPGLGTMGAGYGGGASGYGTGSGSYGSVRYGVMGSADGDGGLGTRGRGAGSSGLGSGGGSWGSSSALGSGVSGGVGGLIGAKGVQYGSAGLSGRGTGLGGGGTADMGSSAVNLGAKREGPLPSTRVGEPVVLGSLDRSLIDAVIKRHMNQIRYAYERELQLDPSLQGRLVMEFTIAPDGSVASVKVAESTLSNANVESRVSTVFLRMRFPAPAGGGVVIVKYPLIFAPKE
ncbi:MAG: AgmX/PglI C-terminal domain-containing protein [Alphaproteobacteria bacterium]|nr:AgmX/PglI C-terminal domain-containing protein [Alphaproteobacteria bacterium]